MRRFRSFLCMRRDVSGTGACSSPVALFSLHAQRCFYHHFEEYYPYTVFSACAEMFLAFLIIPFLLLGFLCMRRDVSEDKPIGIKVSQFSLHAQRCF